MPEVIIIGGGFSGICMAIQLKRKLGMQDFLLFDRGSKLGGVWANHVYPGVRCDIPTALYSLSFGQRYWKDLFSSGRTIQGYIEKMASDYHILESNTCFLSEVVSATWNEKTKLWTVRVMDTSAAFSGKSKEYTCKVLISAVGNMSIPNTLDLEGQDAFLGSIVHSGTYPASLSLKDKNVVVVGNGCSAHQIVPTIAPHVKSLTIFAPSRHWILPQPSLPLPWLFDLSSRYTSVGKTLLRFAIFACGENGHRAMHWRKGASYRKAVEQASAEYVNETAPSKYCEQLIPETAFASKRPIFDSGYLQALHRPNVTLLAERPLKLDPSSIVRHCGEQVPADVIIAATGFDAQKFLTPMQVTGQGGVDLQTHMTRNGGITSYKGSFYSRFPNFATIYGPNTGTAHNSAVFMIECQVNMVFKHLVAPVLQEEDVDSVVVRDEKEEKWMTWLRRELADTVWERSHSGWYTDENGLCTANYPRSQMHYWWTTAMTSSRDFIYDPRDLVKSTYGSMREFETFAIFTFVFLLVAFLSLGVF